MKAPTLGEARRFWCWVAVLLIACTKQADRQCSAIDETRLVLHEGSTLDGPGLLQPGERVRCAASPLGPVFAGALSRVPDKLRPTLTVHAVVNPPNSAWQGIVEYHAPSASLLARASAAPSITPSIALHEIAHVALDGARPSARVPRRLHRAVNEAVADYWAAQFTTNPRLGAERLGEIRDLAEPPTVTPAEWARLALPQSFPAHRFAHALASIWWRDAPRDLDYLTDLVSTLATSDPFDPSLDTPSQMVEALTLRCPQRSRRRLSSSLDAWLPPELVESS